ncbi:hypothetical protein [Chimaeribacter californicus]|uniref:hypothetical protein n=1 Tax=Chimaeribacter californicus TaxID=2060067 RepID=UPI0011AF1624|nr:hypothetical protein [Chimaeribacter californicus]
MPAYIIRLLLIPLHFCCHADSRIRALLNSICWFTSLSALTEEESPVNKDAEEDIAASWTQLWGSAGKLCLPASSPVAPPAKAQRNTGHPVRLRSHKRDELDFLFLISSLHHLMMCRHASGEADDAALPFSVLLQSTMRLSPLCFFYCLKLTR